MKKCTLIYIFLSWNLLTLIAQTPGRVVSDSYYLWNVENDQRLFIKDTAIQSDGKIITSGTAEFRDPIFANLRFHFILHRQNVDGTLDESFGKQGFVKTDVGIPNGLEGGQITIDTEGNIIIAGHQFGGDVIVVVKYHPNGDLYESFGDNGIALFPFCLLYTSPSPRDRG